LKHVKRRASNLRRWLFACGLLGFDADGPCRRIASFTMRSLEMCRQLVIAGNRGFCNPNPRWSGDGLRARRRGY